MSRCKDHDMTRMLHRWLHILFELVMLRKSADLRALFIDFTVCLVSHEMVGIMSHHVKGSRETPEPNDWKPTI